MCWSWKDSGETSKGRKLGSRPKSAPTDDRTVTYLAELAGSALLWPTASACIKHGFNFPLFAPKHFVEVQADTIAQFHVATPAFEARDQLDWRQHCQ